MLSARVCVLLLICTVGVALADNTVVVGNLPQEINEDELRILFSQAGEVNNVRILFDRETGQSTGFARVEFVDEESAENAVNTMNGLDFMGKSLTIEMADDQ